MIARGDLAIELGFQRIAEMQEEILWLCEAAHIPVIWATQVLERLAKEGLPTRAEVTDAAMANRAECVMLNKGPYILDVLSECSMGARPGWEGHQHKKTPQLRVLHSWQAAFSPGHAGTQALMPLSKKSSKERRATMVSSGLLRHFGSRMIPAAIRRLAASKVRCTKWRHHEGWPKPPRRCHFGAWLWARSDTARSM